MIHETTTINAVVDFYVGRLVTCSNCEGVLAKGTLEIDNTADTYCQSSDVQILHGQRVLCSNYSTNLVFYSSIIT